LVEGLLRLMNSEPETTGPINLGSPVEFSIRELAETVIRMTRTRSKVVFRALPSDDPLQRQPDISRARAVLGWEPTIELEAGLVKTISYFDKLESAESYRR
jgi:UDP-glucuronate decarboxylase